MSERPPIIEHVNGRVEARWSDERAGTGIAVDFDAIALLGGDAAVRSMPLVRACGRDLAKAGATLVDATAGLGYDAYLLAIAGFRVIAFERSRGVVQLLEDGLRRGKRATFELRHADARPLLATLDADVIYLDPMYPPKRRASALPPKDMQIVRAIVGADVDARDLFDAARSAAPRVVVKRPLHAESFGVPTSTVAGKLARFDVYIR
ncbi:MAG: class I SAM-dependent methyltransferase [Phycisphaerae bacterium]|nr:class I SAM-dependent methyltransferase [Phycisphaerae bacterium]